MIRHFLTSPVGLFACFFGVVMSALSVVSETYQTRILFTKLQAQESERWLWQLRNRQVSAIGTGYWRYAAGQPPT